jgi:hypothetical protein
MQSTFGSIFVHKDATGIHILSNLPKRLEESDAERMLYAGPRMLTPETVTDLDKWRAARTKEGFTFKKPK